MTQPLRTDIAKIRQVLVHTTVLLDVLIYRQKFDVREAIRQLPVELQTLRARIDELLARLEANDVP